MGRVIAAKLTYQPASHDDVRREMQGISYILTLSHPHLLKHFFAEEFFGRLIIAMDLADGNLLDRWTEHRRSESVLASAELTMHMRQAAEALDYIHERGLVHGGVNPEDILLLNGKVQIADPGPSALSVQPLTEIPTGNLSKTICMAPERRRGIEHFQSDQYALAASYVWLRSGQPLFGLETQFESIRSISCVSERECQVLVRALSAQPDARYPTCIEFVDALQTART